MAAMMDACSLFRQQFKSYWLMHGGRRWRQQRCGKSPKARHAGLAGVGRPQQGAAGGLPQGSCPAPIWMPQTGEQSFAWIHTAHNESSTSQSPRFQQRPAAELSRSPRPGDFRRAARPTLRRRPQKLPFAMPLRQRSLRRAAAAALVALALCTAPVLGLYGEGGDVLLINSQEAYDKAFMSGPGPGVVGRGQCMAATGAGGGVHTAGRCMHCAHRCPYYAPADRVLHPWVPALRQPGARVQEGGRQPEGKDAYERTGDGP
jgi:hypothetical protein